LLLSLSSIYSNSSHVGWLAGSSHIILKVYCLRLIQANIAWNWFSGFRREDFSKNIQRTKVGGTTMKDVMWWQNLTWP